MGLTHFPNGITSFGLPVIGGSTDHTTVGNVYYVSSNHPARGDTPDKGSAPDTPFATLDFAIGRCTASSTTTTTLGGDIIFVMPGHNESLIAANAIDADIAGINIIGIGNGADKPTFDHDNPNGEFVIGAADIKLVNLRFRCSKTIVNNAINIEAAGDNFTIQKCDFGFAETAGDEFNDAIIVEAGADNGIIEGCFFDSGAEAAVSAIELNGAVIGITIRDNEFRGDYSTAIIRGDTTLSENVIIERNLLWNGVTSGLNAAAVISMLTGTVGIIRDNTIACDLTSPHLSIVCDGAFMYNNRYVETANVIQGGVHQANAQRSESRMIHEQNPMGNTIYVAASSGTDGALPAGYDPQFPLATIAQAITNGIAGDTIVLGPGTHSVDVSAAALIPLANMQFVGAIKSHGARPAAIITADADDGVDLITINVDGTVWRDITFLHFAAAATALRSVDIGQTAAVLGCTFVDCWFDMNAADAVGVTAINIDDATLVSVGIAVKNCRFVGGSATAQQAIYIDIGVRGFTNGLIEYCMFSCESTDDDCVAIAFADPTTTGRGHGYVIRYNDFIGPTDGAVSLVPVTTLGGTTEYVGTLRSNYFSHCAATAVTQNMMDQSVIENYVGDLTVGGTLVIPGT